MLQELTDAASRVASIAQQQHVAAQERDRLIKNAVDNGIPITRIAKATGLSRNHIYRIINSAQA
ncbi:hypothetical protein CARG_02685 [Corynebacterium argentoratense DSM 44202]|uniref:Resolvase HTH domain-containing protein n=1 Tax=Corynebacterium argentoratense DSM 44202 TaxID=1348662 RepID=U3GXS9_9CORY|nr:helix-turn-helix domain-containing protein [Corynebacterium argentoratense]AGU14187.1 hypothetical protein CARG_02685 [Corynebacterium argentoratense DSM 44202]